ncbi:MAG: Ku protein [Candidatus Rokuibacteriota bacterium]
MASRPLWTGSIAFGLVTIPIQLHRALRDTRPRFRMLHATDKSPVRFERVCEKEDRPVPWGEIVKGYEHAKGEFVVLTREELEAAALQKTSSLDILDFVSAEEIDDRFFETPYYAVPGKGGDRAYAVLRDALSDSGKTGVGKIMLREVQHLAALEAIGDALVVTLMRFSDELADLDEFRFPPAAKGKSREIEMAKSLIAQLSARWTPDKYTDEYQANVMRVIRAKLKGAEPRLKGEKTDARQEKVVDLMERLRQSLAGPRAASARAASDGRGASRSASRAKPRAAASRRKARVA